MKRKKRPQAPRRPEPPATGFEGLRPGDVATCRKIVLQAHIIVERDGIQVGDPVSNPKEIQEIDFDLTIRRILERGGIRTRRPKSKAIQDPPAPPAVNPGPVEGIA